MQRRLNEGKGRKAAAVWAVAIIFTWGCQKSAPSNAGVEWKAQEAKADSQSEKFRLQYKDSVFYYQSSPKNYSVKPFKIPKEAGYFVANPEGLQINASTGEIEVNKSEAGLHYKVYYLSPENEAIDSAVIIISGIDYEDGIFDISNTPGHDLAFPNYDGIADSLPCASTGVDSINSAGCIFDETDLDGDGNKDIDGVNQGKLRVNKKNGSIDLEQSFRDGVFGSLHPQNGMEKEFTIHYRLSDASKKAVNKITIRLYHFSTRENIPAWLIEELKSRKENYETVSASVFSGTVIQSNSVLVKPKRPPLIIIVSGLLSR